MLDTFHEMGIVAILSLLVGLVPAPFAAGYAIWPSESKLALMRPLSLAGIFGGLSGFMVGLINALQSAAVTSVSIDSRLPLLGIAESLVPLCVAFGSLTIAWLLVALGLRRTG